MPKRRKKQSTQKTQKPVIGKGTKLSCGEVFAIANDCVMIDTGKKIDKISFDTAEKSIIKRKNRAKTNKRKR